MIVSFGDRGTEDLYHGRRSARMRRLPAEIRSTAIRKLDMIRAARGLSDVRSPPGNRIETLKGRLAGFHGVRVNDRWRVVFRWAADGAHEISRSDYH